MKALIVDPDLALCTKLSRYLEHEGYRTFTVDTTEKALELLPSVKPNIVILELILRDGLGTSIDRFIRRHPLLYKRVAIIYQSIITDPYDQAIMLKHRPDYVLTKPYRLDDLRTAMEAAQNDLALEKVRSSVTGLLGLLPFERELDYRLASQDEVRVYSLQVMGAAKKGNICSEATQTKIKDLSHCVKSVLTNFGYFESSVYDWGGGTLGAIIVGRPPSDFLKNLKHELQSRSMRLQDDVVATSRIISDCGKHEFDLDRIMRSIRRDMSRVKTEWGRDRAASGGQSVANVHWQG